MKTLRRFSIAPLFILFSLFSPSCDWAPDFGDDFGDVGCLGCGDEDWEINTINEVNSQLTLGTWKLSNININGSIPEWSNFNFVFKPNYTLVATYENTSYSGTWTVTDENLKQNLLSDLKLNLVFSTPSIFNPMSKKWTFNTIDPYFYSQNIGFINSSNGGTTESFVITKEIK